MVDGGDAMNKMNHPAWFLVLLTLFLVLCNPDEPLYLSLTYFNDIQARLWSAFAITSLLTKTPSSCIWCANTLKFALIVDPSLSFVLSFGLDVGAISHKRVPFWHHSLFPFLTMGGHVVDVANHLFQRRAGLFKCASRRRESYSTIRFCLSQFLMRHDYRSL